MSGWLRNIQGQLTDLANEVLNEANDVLAEATEEVQDPDGEIIVAKKKAAEAEKQLAIETSRVELLGNEKSHLEQQLYDAHVEMDAIGAKFNGMVKQRDDEIKKLKTQMEQLQESGWNESTSDIDQICELKKQVSHWKSLAEEKSGDGGGGGEKEEEEMIKLSELEKRIEALRQQKEHEIQSLVESHAENVLEMREMYEEKIAAMQVLPYNASSSTSNADALDAVMLEREDLLLLQHQKSTNGSDGGDGERPVVVDLGSHDELVDERIRQMEVELQRCRDEKMECQHNSDAQIEDLKTQNKELANAYTELNEEFEGFKEQHTATQNANNDLNRRIDSLKANLIEYEERYEICKKESAETASQLIKLTNDFARLKTGVDSVSQRREDCDTMVNEEVDKLRASLEETRQDREHLRSDVQKFQVAVGEIDVELDKLREANRLLLGENVALQENLANYEDTMKSLISSSEQDIGKFREQFGEIQENHKQQREAMIAENDALREESAAIKRQRDIVLEESALLKEVNEKLKQKSATEESKIELLQKKADLLEQVLEEERANHQREKDEAVEQKKNNLESQIQCDADDDDENSTEEQKLNNEIKILKLQLREALDANTEKTEECEKLHIETRNLEREVDLRQNCVDEMIAQTNTLQMQQESMSTAMKTLQKQILANEREICQLEEKLTESELKTQRSEEKVKNLEDFIVGERMEEAEAEAEAAADGGGARNEVSHLKRYIADLQSKLSTMEEELKVLREQKLDENNEATQVRQMLERDLFEAEEVDRGLLEGIENRVKEMEDQLEAKVKALKEAKEESSKLEKKLEKAEKERIALEVLEEQNRFLNEKLEKLMEKENSDQTGASQATAELQNSSISQLTEQLESVKAENARLASEIEKSGLSENSDELRALQLENEQLKLSQSTSSTEELRAAIAVLQQENEHLKGVAKTQYEESVKYYEQFQAMVTHNQQMSDQMEQVQRQTTVIQGTMAAENEAHEKKVKELQRLREHLMIVEETSTREAVEAEQRETELRARVRELETKGHQVEEGASESTQQYQVQIASLTSQVESLQNKTTEWKKKFETEVSARQQTQEALTSLQNVVRELSIDHEKDSAFASHRNLELQTMIGTLNEEIAQIREDLDRQSLGKQASEEESERRQLQLDSKQKIIEDLEVQIEELRSPKKPTESYRIDDSTLRQLFLSYFVSDAAKRPDIALLLANVLEYPAEEMDKFKSAVRQSFGQQQQQQSSSFFFGSARSTPPPNGPTIADQFVRFLEAESESSRTAPHLPIRSQQQPSTPGLSLESPRQKSPNPQNSSQTASASSSAAALDSILR